MNNKQVASNWAYNRSGKSSNGNYHTDGQNLYSYNMLIGRTLPNGDKQVLYVKGKEHSYSVTTSKHVRMALNVVRAGDSVAPIHTRAGYSSWREFPQSFMSISDSEFSDAQLKALENNEEGLEYLDKSFENTDFTMIAIDKLLPIGVRAVAFETYTGDYAPLYVQFDNSSNWYLVREYR